MIRKPIAAGLFYEDSKEALIEQIKGCFENGPGFPEAKKEGLIRGAIVPHAGYPYSGRCAAHAYKEILEHETPDTFIIIGTNHSGPEITTMQEDWETPLGVAKVDLPLVRALVRGGVRNDPEPHKREHSIEVQIPFLQHLVPEFKFVPIVIGNQNYQLAVEAIKKAAYETGRKVCLIASSDFTHYGFTYSYVPFNENIRENIEKLDMGAIEFIKKLDSKGFMKYVEEKEATICGKFAIGALIDVISKGNVELLKYTMSGDMVRDYNVSVSYASIIFS
ncbi:AmmeMemoRadiSam system protein B [Nanoarchaeota archaeon]